MNTPFKLTQKLFTASSYDVVVDYVRKFAEQRNRILEDFLISLCPDDFTEEQERIRFLQNIEIRIDTNSDFNEDRIYSCDGLIAILKFEVKYNNEGVLIAQHTLQKVE